jgi:putative copper resistance protein D
VIVDIANTLAGAATVGLLFALAFLAPEVAGEIKSSLSLRRSIRWVSSLWVVTSIAEILRTLADLFDTSIASILKFNTIRSYVTQTTLGELQLLEVLVSLLVFFSLIRVRRTGGAIAIFLIATIGVTAPLFQSHSSQAGSHGLAIGSLIIHVIALSIWSGSVVTLAMMAPGERELALPRVSSVATWSLVTMVATGATSSLLRLGFTDSWLTPYGAMITLKLGLLGVIITLARKIRLTVEPENLLKFESALLVVVITIGAMLSRFTPEPTSQLPYDRARELVGITMPAEPTLMRVFFEYEADGLILGALIFLTALYIRGVVSLVRRGDKWPVGRTISFAFGISLLDYATSGGLGLYSVFSFQYHMIAHMVLSMIAPIALVLSAPMTLALRTLPIGRTSEERGLRGWVLTLIHSRFARIWTHPVFALALFDGSLFALYFTPLFSELMSSHFGHFLMNLHFIGVGFLFFYVIIGIDPNPRRTHHLVRMIILLAAMSIHAFFSIALMSSTTLIDGGYYEALQRPWATDLLADQELGAAIGWAMGEIPIVAALIATFIQWMRADRREAKRADKNAQELAEYNEYLRKLAERNPDS